MSLIERIRKDSVAARKEKSPSAGVLVTLLGEISTREKTLSPARPLTDDEVLAVVRKFVKNTDETLAAVASRSEAGAEDAQAQLRRERAALEVYLPKQMSRDELAEAIRPLVAQGKSLGEIMGHLKAGFSGRYDGRMASEVAKELLATAG